MVRSHQSRILRCHHRRTHYPLRPDPTGDQSLADISKYKKYLLSQKKIKKATHNISAYRFLDKKSQEIFEDYDDDGEDDAGIRLLGIIQKMKVNNVLVVVSRWFGGILLHHDRFKHINDVAKILLTNNIEKFK